MFLRSVEVLLGLTYFIFGIDGFFHKIPLPEPSPRAKKFLLALEETGYMMPLIKGIEIVGGLLLLLGLQAQVGAYLVLPLTINITAYHLFLNRKEFFLPFLIFALQGLVCILQAL